MSDVLFIRDLILARVSDEVDGLNPSFQAVAEAANILKPMEQKIDFNPGTSHQLVLGEVHPADLDKTTANKYPQFHCWVKNANDEQTNMGGEFSGQVIAQIRILVQWRKGSAQGVDYDALTGAFITAMGTTFNRQIHRGWASPAIAQPYRWDRIPVELCDEYWRQGILFTMPFLVDV